METIKNRMLLFAVRQILGRIVKDIQSEQLERIERSKDSLGITFELSHLELNDAFINHEILGIPVEDVGHSASSTPLSGLVRLVHGYINTIRGDFGFSPKGHRKIEIDGLQLVLDVIPKVECTIPTGRRHRSAGNQRGCEMNARSAGGFFEDDNTAAVEDAIYSSLFMSDTLRKGVEEGVVVPALHETCFPESQTLSCRRMIDEGLEVFERTIKQFAHSVSGCIRNVSIILRIPPLGDRIMPGQEPPDGSLELLVLFKGGFELEDMCSDPAKDIIYKRIRFSSPQVAVYKYGERHTTRFTDEEVEESVDLADVFLSGGHEENFKNDVVLQFSEGRNAAQGPEALLDVKVTTKSIFFILPPTQLSHLVQVARALVGAPESNNNDDLEAVVAAATTFRVVRFVTTIKVTCQHISCTLLLSEDQQATKEFWQTLRQGDEEKTCDKALPSARQHQLILHRLFHRIGFYNVFVSGIMLLLEPVPAGTNRSEDAFYDVFENYGGRGCSVGISTIEIYEGYSENCGKDCAGFAEGGRLILTTKENTENCSERCYRIAFVSRTTYPLTLAEARQYCTNLPEDDNHATAIVVEHVLVTTAGAVVLVELDAGVLERLATLWAQLQRIVNTALGTGRPPKQHQGEATENTMPFPSLLVPLYQPLQEELGIFEKPVNERQVNQPLVESLTGEDYSELFQETPVTTPYVFLRFFTLQLEGITLEMKFPTSKAPDPDYYGPLTQRLWEHLRDEGEALYATAANTTRCGTDGSFLPLSMSVYLKMLDMSVGSEGVLELFLGEGQITIHDCKEGVQSNIVHCVFDAKHKEPNIAVRQRQSSGLCTTWGVTKKAHAPFGEAYEKEERQAENNSFIAVVVNVRQIRAELHQDEFLLTLFYLDQLAEAVDKVSTIMNTLPKAADISGEDCVGEILGGSNPRFSNTFFASEDEAEYDTVDTDPIITSISVRLTVDEGTLALWAPRLSSAGLSIGEPLWRCIPQKERRRIDESHLYHRYEVTVSKVSVFVFYQASSLLVKTFLHGKASDFCLQEKLCHANIAYADFPWPADHSSTPKWGGVVTLLQSYTALYNRANNIRVRPPSKGSAESARDCQAVGISLCRHRNVEDHTEIYDVIMQLDRISLTHQAAHEGDHWLFVLINCFSDTNPEGLNTAVVEKKTVGSLHSEEGDDVRSYDGVAIATLANVNIVLTDVLLEYRPFGRYSMLVCLAPRLEIATFVPSLPGETTTVKVCLEETISVFLHNNFQQYLLDYDREAGLGSLFGSSERGIAADLKSLGYVLVLDVGQASDRKKSGDSGSEEETNVNKSNGANVTLFINPKAEKPVFVEVQSLHAFMFFAHDSLYHFRLLVFHFLSSVDLFYLPSPHLFVQRSGPHFVHIVQAESIEKEATVPVLLVPDYKSHISRLLNSSVLDIGCEMSEGEEEPQLGIRQASNSPSSFLDFLLINKSDYVFPQVPEWTTRENQPINLVECCAHANFLSVYGYRLGASPGGWDPHVSPGYAQNPKHTLRALPLGTSVTMELSLYGCDVTINLYGGDDFNYTDVPQSYLHTIQRFGKMEESAQESFIMWSGMDSDLDFDRGRREGKRNDFFGSGRRQDEYIVGRFTGIRLQVDVFTPGKLEFMQVYLAVQDGKVVDCIEKSPVRTLFMSSLPQSLRDHDSDFLEVKWTTILPRMTTQNAGKVSVGKPEEQLTVRLQPFTIALHRRAMNLLPQFFEIPENLVNENDIWNTMQFQPLFFSKIVVYPVQMTLYVYFEGQDIFKASCGNVFELCNFFLPSIERVRVQVPPMLITNCPLDNVGEHIGNELRGQILRFHGLFRLLCGIQPLHLASNVGFAGTNVLFTPLNEYRRHKRFFSALSRSFHNFLSALASQSLHCAVTVTQRAHDMTSSMTTFLMPSSELLPISRGSQPVGLLEGLSRGFEDFLQGFGLAMNMAAYCVGPRGNLICLPVAASAIIDGILRGVYDVMCGMRNGVTLEMYGQEKKLFKGNRRRK